MIIYYLKPTTFGFWNEQRDKENIPERVKALSNFMLPLHRHCEHASWAMQEFREIQVDRQGLSVWGSSINIPTSNSQSVYYGRVGQEVTDGDNVLWDTESLPFFTSN